MASLVGDIQMLIIYGLGLVALIVEVYALQHALRQRPDAFVAAGKRTKKFWGIALGVGALLGLASVGGAGLMLLAIIGFVIAAIYLADVKPAIEQVLGRGNRSHGRWG